MKSFALIEQVIIHINNMCYEIYEEVFFFSTALTDDRYIRFPNAKKKKQNVFNPSYSYRASSSSRIRTDTRDENEFPSFFSRTKNTNTTRHCVYLLHELRCSLWYVSVKDRSRDTAVFAGNKTVTNSRLLGNKTSNHF